MRQKNFETVPVGGKKHPPLRVRGEERELWQSYEKGAHSSGGLLSGGEQSQGKGGGWCVCQAPKVCIRRKINKKQKKNTEEVIKKGE